MYSYCLLIFLNFPCWLHPSPLELNMNTYTKYPFVHEKSRLRDALLFAQSRKMTLSEKNKVLYHHATSVVPKNSERH